MYKGLDAKLKEKVAIAAIGRDEYTDDNDNFCQGAFGAGYSSAWTDSWSLNQRDVVILVKENGEWHPYCRFSMNTFDAENEVEKMIKSLSEATSAPTTTPQPTEK